MISVKAKSEQPLNGIMVNFTCKKLLLENYADLVFIRFDNKAGDSATLEKFFIIGPETLDVYK